MVTVRREPVSENCPDCGKSLWLQERIIGTRETQFMGFHVEWGERKMTVDWDVSEDLIEDTEIMSLVCSNCNARFYFDVATPDYSFDNPPEKNIYWQAECHGGDCDGGKLRVPGHTWNLVSVMANGQVKNE